MSIRAFALTAAIFGAATMFFLAWWLILTGNVIGAIWGFVDFGIAGAIFAWLYNKLKK